MLRILKRFCNPKLIDVVIKVDEPKISEDIPNYIAIAVHQEDVDVFHMVDPTSDDDPVTWLLSRSVAPAVSYGELDLAIENRPVRVNDLMCNYGRFFTAGMRFIDTTRVVHSADTGFNSSPMYNID